MPAKNFKSGSKGKFSKQASSGSRSASKSKPKPSGPLHPTQQKTKRTAVNPAKKRRVYTEKELNIPKLNMITPAGVQKPKGKKKGIVLVDDQEGMMTILAMVNADIEGQIESKMMKARQMEEIRQARQKETESKQEEKKSKLDEAKASIRRGRKRKSDYKLKQAELGNDTQAAHHKRSKKTVSFG